MICADFLAGANLDNGNPEILLSSITRFFKFLPGKQRQQFLSCMDPGSFMIQMPAKRQRLRLEPHSYKELCQQVLQRDNWRASLWLRKQAAGPPPATAKSAGAG